MKIQTRWKWLNMKSSGVFCDEGYVPLCSTTLSFLTS